jgi:hypothetical protein
LSIGGLQGRGRSIGVLLGFDWIPAKPRLEYWRLSEMGRWLWRVVLMVSHIGLYCLVHLKRRPFLPVKMVIIPGFPNEPENIKDFAE